MYDLLILSSLLIHDRTGYKLRRILEGTITPRRQISNGVMYPLLHKLQTNGYIELADTVINGRDQKIASITPRGREYFEKLMRTPVAMDAKRESIFRFKFRAFGRETVGYQRETLQAYQAAIDADIAVYQAVIVHLKDVSHQKKRSIDTGWSIRTLELTIAVAHTQRKWADTQLAAIKNKADDDHFYASSANRE